MGDIFLSHPYGAAYSSTAAAGSEIKRGEAADQLSLNRNTAYLFQNPDYQLFLSTVRDELSLGLKGEKADKK